MLVKNCKQGKRMCPEAKDYTKKAENEIFGNRQSRPLHLGSHELKEVQNVALGGLVTAKFYLFFG